MPDLPPTRDGRAAAFASHPHLRRPAGRPRHRLAAAVLAAALAGPAVVSRPATAQRPAAGTGVVTGVVLAEGSQRALPDAQVSVEGTTLGTTTDASGRFRIAGVNAATGTDVRLVVRRIGYEARTMTARVGGAPAQVAMIERVLELNQVVVTGAVGETQRRAVGNAVSNIDAAQVVATQPVRNFQDLLTGRASGVSVVASSGQVGTGSRIRIRGASSLSLANDPLIYVDGVRVDNAQATGPTNQAFGSSSISRFNDFNPDDIESIEVIKGPAAATLYGTEASNGVIQIVTKKGAAGRPVFNALARVGNNYVNDWQNRFYTNYGSVPRAGSATLRDTVTITPRQLNDSLVARYGNDILRTGLTTDYQASVSGGGGPLRYYVAANHDEDQGVERANRLNRTSFRANLTVSPIPSVDVVTSLGYTAGRTYLPEESGGGGAMWATFFSSPGFLYNGVNPGNPQLGFRSGPPDAYYQAYSLYQDQNRFTGSLSLTNRPAEWFDHRFILGVDRSAEDNQDREPRNDYLGNLLPSFSGLTGTNAGFLNVTPRNVNLISADYAANAKFTLGRGWRSVTSVGGQFYGRRTIVRGASASGFPAAGILSLAAAAMQSQDYDDQYDVNTLGGFVQEQAIWNDRLFLTGALRRDRNSAFGASYPYINYPKAQVSYVASEEPALHIPKAVNSLRLRAAYGGSGLQPGAFDALTTYQAVAGTVTPSNIGNQNLGPERSAETELGVDAGLFGDRIGAELTYYDGRTRDAILSRQAGPSLGFPGLQFFNAGRVDRHGFEWMLRAQPVRGDNVSLDLQLNGSVNTYTIQSLGDNTTFVSYSAQIAHVVGYAPGSWFDRRVVSATYDPSTKTVPTASLMCDDGKGGAVGCYTNGVLTAPRVFLGNSVPTREGGFTAGLSFLRSFRANAVVDYRGGYKKLDGNRRVRCNLFSLCEEDYYPDRFANDPVMLASVQRGTAFTYDLIRDASFARFRELSLTYNLPRALAARARASAASVTLAGRNLHLWTNYPGMEPEASFNGGTRGGSFGQWEQNVLPQTRSFVTTFNLSF